MGRTACNLLAHRSPAQRSYAQKATTCVVQAKRPWYRCAVTGRTVYMPEPLVSRYKWFGEWRSYVSRFGLSLSEDGSVCERGLLDTAVEIIARDKEYLRDPAE
eukprot:4116532-Pleurochrysis_carterae.AAC.1